MIETPSKDDFVPSDSEVFGGGLTSKTICEPNIKIYNTPDPKSKEGGRSKMPTPLGSEPSSSGLRRHQKASEKLFETESYTESNNVMPAVKLCNKSTKSNSKIRGDLAK